MKQTLHIRIGYGRCAFRSIILLMLCLIGVSSTAWAIERNYGVFGDDDGNIYSLPKDESLRWFQHNGRLGGTHNWANNAQPKVVSVNGSAQFSNAQKVFSGGEGVIYIIDNFGRLFWTRHDGRYNGTPGWANSAQQTFLGNGWDKYEHVFSGGDGIIYGITSAGKMHWYRHSGWLDGTNTWSAGTGKEVNNGWQGVSKVFSGGDGVIYSIMPTGRLRWHRHDGRLTGAVAWANNGVHKVVGFNWQTYRQVFSSGDGIVYGITAKGDLVWHRHIEWLTGNKEALGWTSNSGKIITRAIGRNVM